MRRMVFFMFVMCMAASARSNSQTVRLKGKSMTLPALFKTIRGQTGYVFAYGEHVLDGTKEVHLPAGSLSLTELLDKALHPQGLAYSIESKTIFITKAPANKAASSVIEPATAMAEQPQETIHGRVVDSLGNPLPGATIKVRGTDITAIADRDGRFSIETADAHPVLEISYIGYQTITIEGSSNTRVVLHERYSELDETVMMAYGKTSRRYNTGNISKVTAEEIEQQPVGNVLQALQGRVPGLNVTTTSGVPGASVKIQVRGQNSIIGGNDPLILIDGAPYGPNNNNIGYQTTSAINSNPANNITGITSGLSPFNTINPSDIESIEVLKDADATAIYGSRGANGVILITTKKGKQGISKFKFNIYSGISKATKLPKMMNTQQYLAMRHEAFNNDGELPDESNAPDLTIYDTTRYTDFVKEIFGGTAHFTNINASVSGGNANTSYLIAGTYRSENNIYSKYLPDRKGTVYSNINSQSNNQKFKLNFNISYTYDNNKQITNNLATFTNITPDIPALKDDNGDLIWYYNGINIQNPLANFEYKYSAKTDNLNGSTLLSYEIMKGLSIKTSMGYNKVALNEQSLYPNTGQNPEYGISRASEFTKQDITSWSIEPQMEYSKRIEKGNLNILLGSTWQSLNNATSYIRAMGQSSDALLEDLAAATSTILTNFGSLYRYNAFFGRINYNWDNRYILNLSGRRDGSSRFGVNHRFANFGAVGAAWLFSNENFIKDNLAILSFGKLRGSFGVTGNDQIGDYKYMDSWSSTSYSYNGISGLTPTLLANNDFSWEKNKKLEFGLELGFLQDKFLLTTSWFRNRSSNMLINYPLPTQTGFSTVLENFPGLVQNTGWELTANLKILNQTAFKWSVSANMTLPQNKLLAYPGLAQSSYKNTYTVGQSLSNKQGYKYTGVDPTTGLFTYQDSNGDGTPDRVPMGDLAPKYYGGITSSFSYKGFDFSLFVEFKKQFGFNYMYSTFISSYPGMLHGIYPVELLNRWQKAGDQTDIPKLSQSTSSEAYAASSYFVSSTGIISDASYVRLKTVALSYTIPLIKMGIKGIENCKIYAEAQNLFTLTGYKVLDPETQSIYIMPPLRTIVWGIQISL